MRGREKLELILHIGSPKTGSTSLQWAFENNKKLLERQKIYYPLSSKYSLFGRELNIGKKMVAKALEKRLFNEGKYVYFLGIGNLRYGVDADIVNVRPDNREEHVRRLSKVANILLDAGSLLIVTAVEFTQSDLEIVKTVIGSENISVVWLGSNISTDISHDLHIPHYDTNNNAALQIKKILLNNGRIFKVE